MSVTTNSLVFLLFILLKNSALASDCIVPNEYTDAAYQEPMVFFNASTGASI